MVSLDAQRTEHCLSNLALIAPSRSEARPSRRAWLHRHSATYILRMDRRASEFAADEVERGTAVRANAAV